MRSTCWHFVHAKLYLKLRTNMQKMMTSALSKTPSPAIALMVTAASCLTGPTVLDYLFFLYKQLLQPRVLHLLRQNVFQALLTKGQAASDKVLILDSPTTTIKHTEDLTTDDHLDCPYPLVTPNDLSLSPSGRGTESLLRSQHPCSQY